MKGWLSMLVFGLLLPSAPLLRATEAALIRIDGPIGPATASYIERAIKVATDRQDACLIVELDTPGGLLDSTKEIVQHFYASAVPTVVYVSPSGANAGSAGCFITLAADIAAMAPSTSIGAAHPVSIGPGGSEKLDDVMKEKLENFASSSIEAIASRRGRNVEWAKSSVVKSEAITAEKALELKVIDLVAKDVPELLKSIDGKKINGKTLQTAGLNVQPIPMILRERVFALLSRPEMMLILMLAAIYGLIGELSNPGAILPGVVGAIALILMLYMMSVLPVNAVGVALIGLAVILFVIDIFAPTHGVLTGGGIISFFLGAVALFNGAVPGFRLSMAYILPATILTALFFIFVVGAGLRAQLRPVQAGPQTMLGQTVPALTAIDSSNGKVFLEGEYWNAISDIPVKPGDIVEVVSREGLTLRVKPVAKS